MEIRPVSPFLVYFVLFSCCNYLPCHQTVFINNKILSFVNTYYDKYVKMTDAFLPVTDYNYLRQGRKIRM